MEENKCPNCGASLNISRGEKKLCCEHCQTILADAWFKKGVEELESCHYYFDDVKRDSLKVINAWKLAFVFAEDSEEMKRNIIIGAYDAIVAYTEKQNWVWRPSYFSLYSETLKNAIRIHGHEDIFSSTLERIREIGENIPQLNFFGYIFDYLIQLDKTKEVIKYYLGCVMNMYSLINDSICFLECSPPHTLAPHVIEMYSQNQKQIIEVLMENQQIFNEEKCKYEKLLSEIDSKTENIILENTFEEQKSIQKNEETATAYGCGVAIIVVFVAILLILLAGTLVDSRPKFVAIEENILMIGFLCAFFGGIAVYYIKKSFLQSKIGKISKKMKKQIIIEIHTV